MPESKTLVQCISLKLVLLQFKFFEVIHIYFICIQSLIKSHLASSRRLKRT